jgi:hypothetical protein
MPGLPVYRIIYGDAEKFTSLLKAIGTEVPSHAHTRRYGVTAKRAFFLHKAATVDLMKMASVRIAPALHADRLESAIRADRVIDPGTLTVS